mgnify:CR=1 FL=1
MAGMDERAGRRRGGRGLWRRAALTVFAILVAAGDRDGLRADEPAPLVVAIDPGHGGHDPGAVVGDLMEKDIVLDFSHRLAAEIAGRAGLEARLTRSDDRFLGLRERLDVVRGMGAALLLSIHADSAAWGNASGLSIYTLSEGGRARAQSELTERTARDEAIRGLDLAGKGDDVTRALVDLAQRSSLGEGERFVAAAMEALSPDVKLLRTRPHRRAAFTVLRAADMPAVLVELGFMSNADDRARLEDAAWRAKVATRLADALAFWRRGRVRPGSTEPRGGLTSDHAPRKAQ